MSNKKKAKKNRVVVYTDDHLFPGSNDSERRAFSDGVASGQNDTERHAFFAGVGYGKRERKEALGFKSKEQQEAFERGVNAGDRHFTVYTSESVLQRFLDRLVERKQLRSQLRSEYRSERRKVSSALFAAKKEAKNERRLERMRTRPERREARSKRWAERTEKVKKVSKNVFKKAAKVFKRKKADSPRVVRVGRKVANGTQKKLSRARTVGTAGTVNKTSSNKRSYRVKK